MLIAYIDAQNIFQGTKWLGRIIDWKKIYEYLQKRYNIELIKIFFWYLPKYKAFYDFLKRVGYDVIFKEVTIHTDGTIKWNVDIDIAIHAVLDLQKCTMAFLLSSYSDYNTLIDLWHDQWKLWKVIVTDISKTAKVLRKASRWKIQSLSDIRAIIQSNFLHKQKHPT